MSAYFADCLSSLVTTAFLVFAIAALGYFLGGIKIKGVALGDAGILLAALAYGVLASYVPSFTIGGTEIVLFSETSKELFSLVSKLGTALFVTAVGLIAGPKFFRSFNRETLKYILMGVTVILLGTGLTVLLVALSGGGLSASMAAGLLTGALTSTPGLSAAKEVAADPNQVTAGYGIAYIFGVLGVVFFVQLMPKLLKVDIARERERFVSANAITLKPLKGKLVRMDAHDFFPFMLAVVLGMLIGCIKIPGVNFSLGASGGTLVGGLIVGHFGRVGRIDCRVRKENLNFFRELGLMLFLIGAGVPGGINFVANVKLSYFLFGILITTIPMVAGFLLGKYVFHMSIFNNLGSITGGMTSTPALGALISTAGTDDVASTYAATYPFALVCIVLAAKLLALLF